MYGAFDEPMCGLTKAPTPSPTPSPTTSPFADANCCYCDCGVPAADDACGYHGHFDDAHCGNYHHCDGHERGNGRDPGAQANWQMSPVRPFQET